MSQQTKSLAELLRDAASSLEFEVESAKLHFTGEMLAIMEERGISRSELAARLGVKPARITALLRGDNNFTLETMIRICRALGVKYSHHLAEAGCVTLPTAKAEDIPSEMARRFLELFSKADHGWLDEGEQAAWVEILDRIDYQAFCIDRAQPHYMEGEVTSTAPKFVWVEWHDGTREKIEAPVHRSLARLRKGDAFGAYVKLGRENRTLSIENVTLLNDRPSIDLSE